MRCLSLDLRAGAVKRVRAGKPSLHKVGAVESHGAK